ncbi:MAG: nitrate reductase, partial [Geodermatophilaceae bacterium]|nr:nitrate reductase [Geodermatophilaceae bacterium]
MAFSWKLYGDGKTPPIGEAVAPEERLTWARTSGIGAQHVVAMFGATFVFPLIMGLDPNLAIMMSGIATIIFLLIVQGKVPSYLGTSASFVGGVFAIRAGGGDSGD